MLDKERFIQVLSGLCDLYGKSASEFIFNTYYEIFKDYTNEALEGAIKKCLRERVYSTLPKPAEILEFLEGTRDDKALIAWLQAKGAASKVGHWHSVEFKDPLISHCLQELGGWIGFCSAQIDELPFIEKRFMNLYNLFLKRETKEPVKLIGYVELKNFELGYSKDIPKPTKIGFEEDILTLTHNGREE